MTKALVVVILSCIASSLAAKCSTSNLQNITCPTTESKPPNYCASPSLTGEIIIRCTNGCPTAGNCADNLSGVAPVGVKTGALCWDEGSGGNAQCAFDCVSVTALNGSVFYPLGCKSLNDNGTAPTISPETGSSLFRPLSSVQSTITSRKITLAPGPVVVSTKVGGSTSESSAATTTTGTSLTTGSTTGGAVVTASLSGNAAVGKRDGMMKMPESIGSFILIYLGLGYLLR